MDLYSTLALVDMQATEDTGTLVVMEACFWILSKLHR
jgi:hypothetical protein